MTISTRELSGRSVYCPDVCSDHCGAYSSAGGGHSFQFAAPDHDDGSHFVVSASSFPKHAGLFTAWADRDAGFLGASLWRAGLCVGTQLWLFAGFPLGRMGAVPPHKEFISAQSAICRFGRDSSILFHRLALYVFDFELLPGTYC